MKKELKYLFEKPTLYIQKNLKDIYNDIINYCVVNNINDIRNFKQKLYHYYYEISNKPLCKQCNKNTVKFLSYKDGYRQYCSSKCRANSLEQKEKKINTLKEKYGDNITNISQVDFIKEKKRSTCIEKYGVGFPIQVKEFKHKMQDTLLKKFGTTNASKSIIIKQKISNSLKKINKENGENIHKKRINSLKRRYGQDIFNSCQLIINKKESSLEKKLRELLNGEKIKIKFKEFDIFLKDKNIIIEVDGENYHPGKLENIQFYQLQHVINDIQKEKILNEIGIPLYRIKFLVVKQILKLNIQDEHELLKKVIENSYTPNRNFQDIKNVITIETISNFYTKTNYKEFSRNILKLRILFKYKFNVFYKTNEEFLSEIYNITFYQENPSGELLKNFYSKLKYSDILISKEFLTNYINKHGKEALEIELDNIFLLIRENVTDFIYPLPTESLEEIINKIYNYNINYIFDKTSKVFKNTSSITGINYLKSIFKSYFHSSFHKNLSPYDMFFDDEKLKSIIKYRIGLNNQNEIYDLSFKNIIKGMSAIRKTISFFKPIVAGKIYRNFIKEKTNPIVLDPCMGFGGRMLGFFSEFKNGTYIGCEPNIDTYNELCILKKNLSLYFGFEIKAELYNMTIEEFSISQKFYDIKEKIDLTFTSIPYYDLEVYSNDIVSTNYIDFNDWKTKFISCVFSLPNFLINLPIDLFNKLEFIEDNFSIYYLENVAAKHFNKVKNKKMEYIIKSKN